MVDEHPMISSGGPQKSGRFKQWFGRWEARDVAPLVSLAVLVVFFAVAAPNFLRPASLLAVLKQGSALAIVAVGLTYVLICAEIDLAVGMTALWAACLCGWLFQNWGWFLANGCGLRHVLTGAWAPGPPGGEPAGGPALVAVILIPLAASLALGLASGMLTVWSRLPSFIITLAMMFIAEGMSRFLTKSATFKIPELLGRVGNEVLDVGAWLGLPAGLRACLQIPYSAVLAAFVLVAGHVVLQHTRFGRYVYMTGGNREAARLAGVRTSRIVVACLALCAFTAGLGGLLNAGRLTNATLDQNKDLLLSAVACVVLGGTSLFGGEGGIGKTLIGVLTFTVLNVGLIQVNWINDLARQLLTGLVLLVALVVNGLLAKGKS
jgi:ribose transport system permease protein